MNQKEVENQTDTRRWNKSQKFSGGWGGREFFSSSTTFLEFTLNQLQEWIYFLFYWVLLHQGPEHMPQMHRSL
jgi:hypothetical protein